MLKQRMFGMMFNDWMRVIDYKVNDSTKECIGAYYRQDMGHYETWYCDNEERMSEICSLNGCDYEADFDFDDYMEEQYLLIYKEFTT